MIDPPLGKRGSVLDSLGPAIDLDYPRSKNMTKFRIMNLKKQLRFYLDRNAMTATDLAKKTKISKQVISLWLAGASPKKLEQVKAVADEFGITVDNLCFGTGITEELDQEKDDFLSGIFEIKVRRIK